MKTRPEKLMPGVHKKKRARHKEAPDWFGCGRVITQASWDGFLAAQRAYYAKKDAEAAAKAKGGA